jgi:hypothetical protein
MNKTVLLIAALWAVGSMGLGQAQDATPVARSHPKSVKKVAQRRIVHLKDRIKSQRERIEFGLKAKTLTADQAASCRTVLDSVENQMKTEHQANGSKKTMKKEQYDAYNTSLDANSVLINEERQYFYYYGPYADYGPYYDYYYDAYPGAGAPITDVSALEKAHPRIYELNARIKNQRDRIDQGVRENSLTGDQASACRAILDSVEKQMKTDYAANGSKKEMVLTKEQYTTFNNSLDSNSSLIHEEKQYFYYYGSYENQYVF